jgi:hypothetical protein
MKIIQFSFTELGTICLTDDGKIWELVRDDKGQRPLYWKKLSFSELPFVEEK